MLKYMIATKTSLVFVINICLLVLLLAVNLQADTIHIVRDGETLWRIAIDNGITINEIKEWNNLSDNVIRTGQRLILKANSTPTHTPTPIYHNVSAGNTLYGLARRYNTTEANIRQWNDLQTSNLRINQRLIVGYETPTQVATPTTPTPTPTQATEQRPVFHVVHSGETMTSIAQRYDIDIIDLLDFNKMTNTSLYIGQRIYLEEGHITTAQQFTEIATTDTTDMVIKIAISDSTATEQMEIEIVMPQTPTTHIVARSETLYSIAIKYGVSVDNIRRWNNLNNNLIHIGQTLIINDTDGTPQRQQTQYTTQNIDLNTPVLPIDRVRILSEYGMRRGRMHKGIDLAGARGDPLYAVLDGRVVFSGVQRGFGNVVIIDHGENVMTLYAHNETNIVKKDDNVSKGQLIARVGRTGNASGYHLHFEYRLRGVARNPRELIGKLL